MNWRDGSRGAGGIQSPEMTMTPASSSGLASTDSTALSRAGSGATDNTNRRDNRKSVTARDHYPLQCGRFDLYPSYRLDGTLNLKADLEEYLKWHSHRSIRRVSLTIRRPAHHHAAAHHHHQAAHHHDQGQHEEAKKHATAAHEHTELAQRHTTTAHGHSHN